uniref:Phosphotransferase n=1 Tax=Periophthalmus magnuspinnatus TaxID=409849 RepID=A0A3B3ZA18_9GOBI
MCLREDQLQIISVLFEAEMKKGLSSKSRAVAAVKMLPTHVCASPNRSESGQYLGLELEETRVRAVLLNIRNGQPLHHTNLHHKIYEVPLQRLHTGAEEYFDHVAQCISDFLDFVGKKNTCLPAALTVSFPCEQTATDKGTVLNWSRCVKATDCERQDVVTMLREAIDRHGTFDLDIVAVVNDTVGTMISCAYDDPQCEVGLIVGTGVNIFFTENKEQRMCINTECGRLGENGSLNDIITPYDIQVDLDSLHPGKQRYKT